MSSKKNLAVKRAGSTVCLPHVICKRPNLEDYEPRNKRRMYAVLLMYSGWGYFGMQRNVTHPTIEGEISKTLIQLGYLEDMSPEAFKKIWFQRASKTDKSVSAIGQVCSMLLPENEDLVKNLNSVLPENIRVIDAIRATRNFSCHTACSHRVYDYVFPTFALAPQTIPYTEQAHWAYRVNAERLTCANTILNRFTGTHNFYNFTSRRLPSDKSCFRYVISFECLPPFLYENAEYAVIRVVGQSFMLHQIRKMIGLMLAIVRGNALEDVLEAVFGTERVDVPKAPGLGLILNQVAYTRYNEKFGNDGFHSSIDWSNYKEQTTEFKMKYIYPHIHKTEVEERSMFSWIGSLNLHSYGFRSSSDTLMKTSAEINLPVPSIPSSAKPVSVECDPPIL